MSSILKVTIALITALATLGLGNQGPELDPKCPHGSHPGFVINSFQYDIPYHHFAKATQSFFDIKWYAGKKVTATTGTDTVIGATRSGSYAAKGPYAGAGFKETLVTYVFRPATMYIKYINSDGPITVTGQIPHNPDQNLTLISYTEDFRVFSICDEKATYLDFTTTFCANKPEVVYDIFTKLHGNLAIEKMGDKFGGNVFWGSCPAELD
ncbi:hypothetical protein C8J56DRAFT_1042293 [Mycena floridula]|nr:hypothetical protein C8J56DRAFT_1042293 [Mycena floridula]